MAPAAILSRTDSLVDDPKNKKVLSSKWPAVQDLFSSPLSMPNRFEGEIADLVVSGTLPKELNGTFYRIMIDSIVPPHDKIIPLDGDGNISAMRFHDGQVDLKTKYVETQKYLIEKKAGKSMFGLYRNPFSHHPCVRAAVDSTANTNLVGWAGHLLAMKESALPYAVDPDTLETKTYDPFKLGVEGGKTFSAHPRYDPYRDELVCYGYEAKGLATNDIVTYSLTPDGKPKSKPFWLKQPWAENRPGAIHDCAITKNWLLLFIWPFEASIDRMKAGGHHWAWNYSRGHTIIVVPRNPENPPAGWKAGETRYYQWKNCMAIHTAAAWEDDNDSSKIYVESSRVLDNAFPWFPTEEGVRPAKDARADYVRWHINANDPTGSMMEDPRVILDVPAEFPRIDERFMTRKYDTVWMNIFMPGKSDGAAKNIYVGLNGLAQHSNRTGKTEYFYAGDLGGIQEPIFVPRSEDAPEGDGWIMALIERRKENRCDVVVLDTRDFGTPVAMIRMPFLLKSQVHGNWIPAERFGGYRPLVRQVKDVGPMKGGALEYL